ITGRPRPGAGNLSLLDSTFSAMVMIGFHAMMGTPDGVLNHTQSSLTENRYWYNGVESGELAQNAIIAGYYGIPVIMVSGDVATCREAVKFFGEKIVTVPVKKGLSREAAMLYPFDETRQALYDGAIKAMSVISSCKPYKIEFPAKVRMQYLNRDNGKPEPEIITVEGIARDALHILDFERQ
ncbi:MAG: hypothetical protein GX431_14685, partial [Bacteroidales bacterium]|nr:hypothetical protein [Bacteroidales bacterium]